MNLDDHIAALRDLGDEPADGSATRLRVRRTLEHGHATRRHARLLAIVAVLLVASASWGFATGRIQQLWRTRPPIAPPTVVTTAPIPTPTPVVPPVEPRPAVVVDPIPDATPATKPSVRRESAPTSRRYAKAHELYFHGGNYTAALAALDDYLANEPDGQFVVEARYNRALCLIHLDQLADAKLVLQPFADGDVLAGYRQSEAKMLIEKIDHRLNGTR
jgi:hypothetical protein